MARPKDPCFLHNVYENIFIAQGYEANKLDMAEYHCLKPKGIEYSAFCDDFGPMNALSIASFMDIIVAQIRQHPKKKVVYLSEDGPRHLSNAAFLLGSFLMLNKGLRPEEVKTCFSGIPTDRFEHFRDATFSESKFPLSLLDCWKGLEKGKRLGWMDQTDTSEYAHYDDPLNGDLHIVVPGRFVAFKGPKTLPAGREYRDHDGFRDFSAAYYVDIFHELGVTDVVRLNEPEYDDAAFRAAGIAHHDLEFEDCSPPPDAIAAAFLRIVDAARGLVAVHCKAGLGRTGTLIALDMMRTHGFTAREAMGWLRIMRPGSVIGEQQQYLCDVERRLSAAAAAADCRPAPAGPRSCRIFDPPPVATPVSAPARHAPVRARAIGARAPAAAATGGGGDPVLARQVAEAMNRRAAARIRATAAGR
jgi:hypothetical protein